MKKTLSLTMILIILMTSTSPALASTGTKTPWEQMIEDVARENEHLFDKDCPPDYVGQKKCFYIENPEVKNKQKTVKVPKKAPKSGAPIDVGVAIITAALMQSETGQLVVGRGEQAINDIDMYLYDQLPKRADVANFLTDLATVAQSNFINITDDIADIISDTFFAKSQDILKDLPTNYHIHPSIYKSFRDFLDLYGYELIYMTPIYFQKNPPTSSYTYYSGSAGIVTYQYNRYQSWVIAVITPYNAPMTPNFYPLASGGSQNDQHRQDYEAAKLRADNFFLTAENTVSATVFYEELERLKRSYVFNPNGSPTLRPSLHGIALPVAPATPTKVGVTRLDDEDYYEFDLPNPYFNPSKPESPTDNPKDIPAYIPVSNPSATPILGIIPSPNTVVNPDPNHVPNPDPIEPPNPNPNPNPGGEGDINWDKLKNIPNTFTTRFPFSLPWDVGRALASLLGVHDEVKTCWESLYDAEICIPQMFIDWSSYIKTLFLLLFDLGCVYVVHRLLGGAR